MSRIGSLRTTSVVSPRKTIASTSASPKRDRTATIPATLPSGGAAASPGCSAGDGDAGVGPLAAVMVPQFLGADLRLQLQDAVEQRLGARRAAGDVDVDR